MCTTIRIACTTVQLSLPRLGFLRDACFSDGGSVFFATEARRLNGSKIHGFSIGAVKAGPSPGEGHKYVNVETLEGIKESGPSPGEGHKYTNAKTLGGIKESGPSPGEGHKYNNAKTLGGIKDSGPSPGAGH
ncbi:hypothetical protein DH2020_037668 [Rehmannia glutinosa]|uniref:Uncharacterized protein n=1 Tax=Rehmannia glutinosa TaxID=99300 RepID=A0ABR0V1I5_REHGL